MSLLLMVASLMAGMKVVVDAALMLRSLGMVGGGIAWMEFGECVSDVTEVGEEVVVVCACVMIGAPPVHCCGFVACLGGRGRRRDGGNERNFEWRVGGVYAGILRCWTREVG